MVGPMRSLKGRCFAAWSMRCHQVRRAFGGFRGLAASLSASGLRLCLQQWRGVAWGRARDRATLGRLVDGLERLLQGGALAKLRQLLRRMQHQREVLELLQGSGTRSLQRRCLQLWQLSARQRGSAQRRLRGLPKAREAWRRQVCAATWIAPCSGASGACGRRRPRAVGRPASKRRAGCGKSSEWHGFGAFEHRFAMIFPSIPWISMVIWDTPGADVWVRRGMRSIPWPLAWAACGKPWSSAGSSSIAATCLPTAG